MEALFQKCCISGSFHPYGNLAGPQQLVRLLNSSLGTWMAGGASCLRAHPPLCRSAPTKSVGMLLLCRMQRPLEKPSTNNSGHSTQSHLPRKVCSPHIPWWDDHNTILGGLLRLPTLVFHERFQQHGCRANSS